MNRFETNLHGAGLGLRRSLMGPLAEAPAAAPDFLEVAPENWIGVGGRLGRQFRAFTERHRFVLHGLSLSLGGPTPIDRELVGAVGELMRTHAIALYSEHLSYCTDQGHLYDLMPIPFTEAAVAHVAARIRQVQDMLGQRIAIENVSYYAAPGQEMSEMEFLLAVLEAADCKLLLDVNNVYVNAHNHAYDPLAFIQQLPGERIAYLHMAGHYQESETLIIDTHGAEIIDPVWDLLEQTYARFGPLPTLLERDFNLPPLPDLLREVDHIRTLQRCQETVHDKCA
ncbi:MAG: DUF692 domain-containing protein [Candidatus Thiodiazotropha sp.]